MFVLSFLSIGYCLFSMTILLTAWAYAQAVNPGRKAWERAVDVIEFEEEVEPLEFSVSLEVVPNESWGLVWKKTGDFSGWVVG